jgi:hypothetical protein
LEQSSGPGEFNLVTIVEWENGDFFETARQAVAALHPHQLITRLGTQVE